MAKTTNPLNSIEASGSLNGILTFSNQNGRSYVKKWAAPSQPNTKDQMRTRVAMAFGSKLAKDWESLITPRYEEEAKSKNTTARALYIANVTKGFAGGVIEDPEGITISVNAPSSSVKGFKEFREKSIKWTWTYPTPEQEYGWLVSIATTQGETTAVKNATAATGLAKEYIQTDGIPGQVYYMRAILLTKSGRFLRQSTAAFAIFPG